MPPLLLTPRPSRSVRARRRAGIRKTLTSHVTSSTSLFTALLRAGPEPRTLTLRWMKDALKVNAKAGRDINYRAGSESSEAHTVWGIMAVLLGLCAPFINDPEKRKLIDPGFLNEEAAHSGVYDKEEVRERECVCGRG